MKASSYEEIGPFRDARDLIYYWDQTKSVEFEVRFKSQATLFAIVIWLSSRIRELAIQRGVAPETLFNLWVKEKLQEKAALNGTADDQSPHR